MADLKTQTLPGRHVVLDLMIFQECVLWARSNPFVTMDASTARSTAPKSAGNRLRLLALRVLANRCLSTHGEHAQFGHQSVPSMGINTVRVFGTFEIFEA